MFIEICAWFSFLTTLIFASVGIISMIYNHEKPTLLGLLVDAMTISGAIVSYHYLFVQ